MNMTREELVREVIRLQRELMPLYGVRGGLPKKYLALEFQYYKLKGQLELS